MSPYLYSLVLLSLVFIMLAYLKIAKFYKIFDIPNNRSSHVKPTIRGGGILFPTAILLYAIVFNSWEPFFYISLLMVSVVSFLDDLVSISSRLRFVVQFLSSICLIYAVFGMLSFQNILLLPFLIGAMNSYNFMDGINGITAGYSLITIISLLVANHYIGFVDYNLILILLLSTIVFTFFNFRKKAICFAGDVGSVSMAVILLYLILKLIVFTSNPVFILFLVIYGLDTGLTLFERYKKKVNILEPHREHLYQKLVDNKGWSHLKVSSLAMVIQSCINFFVLYFISISSFKYSLSLSIILILVICYKFVKNRFV